MYDIIKAFRYIVFGQFVICNTILASIAVLNLSLIDRFSSLAHVDIYLIFLGSLGLIVIFPILFCELCKRDIFICRAWFECLWVGLFWVLELAGAAAVTAIGTNQACLPTGAEVTVFNFSSPCASTRVLQAFTWICALFLLCYFLLIFVTSLVKQREDRTIWHCNVRKFPWMSAHFKLGNGPSSPSVEKDLPRFRNKEPVIVAPRPRKAMSQAIRQAILSYRSGLSLEYDIEYFRPPSPKVERPVPPVPAAMAPAPVSTQEATNTMLSHSLYPGHVQRAMPQPRAQSICPLPASPPSPSPIGDWPKMNPTARTLRSKRETAPPSSSSENVAPSSSRPLPSANFGVHRASNSRPTHRSLPSSDMRAVLPTPPSATMPPPTSYLPRSRPGGPRRPSIEDNRPPPLDLSRISAFHSRDHS